MGPGASKINENGAQERPKSTKMVPRSAPKVTLEISHEKGQPGTKNCEAFWRHLGDFGRLLGTRRQGGTKIELLGTRMRQNDEK